MKEWIYYETGNKQIEQTIMEPIQVKYCAQIIVAQIIWQPVADLDPRKFYDGEISQVTGQAQKKWKL